MRYVVALLLFISAIWGMKKNATLSEKKLNIKKLLKGAGIVCALLICIPLVLGMLAQQKEENLTQEERIFRELVLCQDEVRKELEEQYPIDSNNSIYWNGNIFNKKLFEENAEKYITLSETAYNPCDAMLLGKYQLSTGELEEIKNKALKEYWIGKLGL